MDRRLVCDCDAANLYLAYFTAYCPFHKAHIAEANYTDTVYGADICIECGESNIYIVNAYIYGHRPYDGSYVVAFDSILVIFQQLIFYFYFKIHVLYP